MTVFYVVDDRKLKTINVSYLKDTEISYCVYTDLAVC